MTEKELFELVRNNYGKSNIDYLKEQAKIALKEPTLSKEETLDGLLDWVVIAGCANVNDFYRPLIFNAISYIIKDDRLDAPQATAQEPCG